MSSTAQNPVNDENARYKRVIRAAEELFKKVGFRAVTMELVAREADVAKATLYSHFKNKDELFLAVCARMAGILRASVEQALMKPDAPLDARLTEAVIAKQRPIFALVRGSAHAAELFTYTHSMAGEPPSALAPPPGCVFQTRCPHVIAICRRQIPAWEAVGEGRHVACHRWREI